MKTVQELFQTLFADLYASNRVVANIVDTLQGLELLGDQREVDRVERFYRDHIKAAHLTHVIGKWDTAGHSVYVFPFRERYEIPGSPVVVDTPSIGVVIAPAQNTTLAHAGSIKMVSYAFTKRSREKLNEILEASRPFNL